MTVYSEIDSFACAWLRNLIAAGHIAPGNVVEGDMRSVPIENWSGSQRSHFFAGIGVWDYALRLAGWPDDVPVWTGSCPCQPFSTAGRRKGKDDARHLWPDWFRLIDQCRPPVIFGEQVASPDGLAWFDTVSSDLEGAGYAVGAADMCAAGVGAPHIRQRLYFVAVAASLGPTQRTGLSAAGFRQSEFGPGNNSEFDGLAHAHDSGPQGWLSSELRQCTDQRSLGADGASSLMGDTSGQRVGRDAGAIPSAEGIGSGEGPQVRRVSHESVASGYTGGFWTGADWLYCRDGKWRPVEPGSFPLAFRSPNRVGRLRGYGNAIVPQVAATFIRGVMQCL